MRHPRRLGGALALAAGLVAGCTSADDPPPSGDETREGTIVDREPDNPEFSPGEEESPEPIPGEDGAARALSVAGEEVGGQPFEVDSSDDDAHWEVTVAVGEEAVEVHVSIDGNAIVGQGGTSPLDDEDRRRLDEVAVTASEAAITAASELGSTVEQVDLADSGDAVVWEIELETTDGASTPATVDAVTGEML